MTMETTIHTYTYIYTYIYNLYIYIYISLHCFSTFRIFMNIQFRLHPRTSTAPSKPSGARWLFIRESKKASVSSSNALKMSCKNTQQSGRIPMINGLDSGKEWLSFYMFLPLNNSEYRNFLRMSPTNSRKCMGHGWIEALSNGTRRN